MKTNETDDDKNQNLVPSDNSTGTNTKPNKCRNDQSTWC